MASSFFSANPHPLAQNGLSISSWRGEWAHVGASIEKEGGEQVPSVLKIPNSSSKEPLVATADATAIALAAGAHEKRQR